MPQGQIKRFLVAQETCPQETQSQSLIPNSPQNSDRYMESFLQIISSSWVFIYLILFVLLVLSGLALP